MIRAIMILIGSLALAGCQHARSFMHMNSDSPSPFFGLQLAVDRDCPAVEIPSVPGPPERGQQQEIDAASAFLASAHNSQNEGNLQPCDRAAGSHSNFSFTATEDVLQGNLKMALPKATPKSGTPEAEQLADLLHRLKQS